MGKDSSLKRRNGSLPRVVLAVFRTKGSGGLGMPHITYQRKLQGNLSPDLIVTIATFRDSFRLILRIPIYSIYSKLLSLLTANKLVK